MLLPCGNKVAPFRDGKNAHQLICSIHLRGKVPVCKLPRCFRRRPLPAVAANR